jgi:hypothetical protein
MVPLYKRKRNVQSLADPLQAGLAVFRSEDPNTFKEHEYTFLQPLVISYI